MLRDAPALADALAARLRAAGVDAVAADALPDDADGVILTGGLGDLADADAAAAVNAQAFRVARALAGRARLLVTLQDTGGRFEPADPVRAWSVGLVAMARTAAQEWPEATVRALDVARGGRDAEALAGVIAHELLQGGATLEVGLGADGARVALEARPAPLARGAAPVDRDAVVVVSGGARGVTARCVIEWARTWGGRFVLLGRSALAAEPACAAGATTDAELKRALLGAAERMPTPAELGRQVRRILAGREIRATLAAVAEAGAQARYVSADVTDRASLSAALAGVRAEWGPVRAVVHGAGVLADKWIADKTDAQFDRVFATKVDGLRALLAATADDPLQVLCAFSSVAARSGNRGQVDYAMANQCLEGALAVEARRRPGCVVKALGWGPWAGGMVTPQLKARFEALGVSLVSLDGGAAACLDDLSDRGGPHAVVLGGEPKASALLDADAEAAATFAVRAGLASLPYLAGHQVAGRPVVPMVLAAEWCARAAQALRPGARVAALRDLRVLRGLALAGEPVLTLEAREAGDEVAVTLRDAEGRPAYQATAAFTAPAAAPLSVAAATPWGDAPVYDGFALFHTDPFRVVEAIDGWSAEGIAGRVSGVSGWPGEPWLTDVAALDGALQLAVRKLHREGAATLPMGFAELQIGEIADGAMDCVAAVPALAGAQATADLELRRQGARVALLRGVRLVRRPDQ